MERLTDDLGHLICRNEECDEPEENCPVCYDPCMAMEKALIKLRNYEDLEEQGLLLKLPCKVGDEFWELNAVNEPFIYPRKALTIQHCVYVLERLGKKAFLTKAEAEKALAEMEK